MKTNIITFLKSIFINRIHKNITFEQWTEIEITSSNNKISYLVNDKPFKIYNSVIFCLFQIFLNIFYVFVKKQFLDKTCTRKLKIKCIKNFVLVIGYLSLKYLIQNNSYF